MITYIYLIISIKYLQGRCNLVSAIPLEYWKYVVLPLAYALLAAVFLMYLKILLVARKQIKSIQLLVVQVNLETGLVHSGNNVPMF